MKRAFLVLVTLVTLAAPASAQFETATVVGTVKDATGAVVPDAKVTLTNTSTGVTAERMSDANGNYEFFTVRIGTYVITAEKAGFRWRWSTTSRRRWAPASASTSAWRWAS